MSVTKDAIRGYYSNSSAQSDAVIQVINIRPIASPSGPTRYRLVVSDGDHYMQSMLHTNLSPLIENNTMKRNSIFKVKSFTVNDVQGRKKTRILVVHELEMITSDVENRIGSPVNIETAMDEDTNSGSVTSAPAAATSAQSSSDNQPLFMHNVSNPAPSAPVNMQMESNLYPIRGLNPYQNKWTIKARVTLKSDIRHWSNARSEGKLFSVHLLDQSAEIKATAFKEQVDRLYDLFEEGKVYYISKARVTMAKRQFSTLDNEYELTFDSGTEVIPCSDEAVIPKMNYSFVKIADMDKREKGDVVDLLAVVRSEGNVQEIVSKATGRPTKKRELTLVDETEKEIRLTLWDQLAESFDASDMPVVACKGVRVNDFNGRSLSMTQGGKIVKNPDVPEASRLQQWYNSNAQQASFTGFGGMSTFGQAAGVQVTEQITLQDVKDRQLGESERNDYFTTRATIAYIKHEGNVTYPSCPDCKKKVIQDTNGWRCEKCDKTHDRPEYRYILQCRLEDATNHIYASAFDEVGAKIMGVTGNQVQEAHENDENAYNRLFADAVFKSFIFKIRAKQEVYNDTARVKFQLMELTDIDYAKESRDLVAAIEKLAV